MATTEAVDSCVSTASNNADDPCAQEIKRSQDLRVSHLEEYPCGPLRAWTTVLGSWMLQFTTTGYMSAFGVLQTYYVNGYLNNESVSNISWIGSMQIFLDASLPIILGSLVDRGYFRHVITTGSLIFVFCNFMLSLAQEHQYYRIFLTLGFGMGIGVGTSFLPTSVVVQRHFKSKKALAVGIITSGGALGGVVYSIALNYLLNSTPVGYGWSIRVTALISLGMLVIGNLIIYEPPHAPSPAQPSDRSQTATLDDKNVAGVEAPVEPQVAPAPTSALEKSSSLLDTRYIALIVSGFIMGLGMWYPSSYVQLFAEQHGISKILSFYAVAILSIASMCGRIVAGWLADKLGALNVYAPCLTIAASVEFAFLGCSTPYGLVLFTIFYGFFFGTIVSLYFPVVAVISPKGADVGKRLGVALFPVGVSSLIGNPINGAILGSDYIWWRGVTFAGVTLLAAAFIVNFLMIDNILMKRRALQS